MVRKGGFEPPRLSAPPPQDGVSASSTTSALLFVPNFGREFRSKEPQTGEGTIIIANGAAWAASGNRRAPSSNLSGAPSFPQKSNDGEILRLRLRISPAGSRFPPRHAKNRACRGPRLRSRPQNGSSSNLSGAPSFPQKSNDGEILRLRLRISPAGSRFPPRHAKN